MRGRHDRRPPQPLARLRLRLHRPARLAGGRPVLVDRLGAVVADQLLAAGRPRVRAAEHGDRRRDRRPVAVDALRRGRRADRARPSRAPSPRSACRRSSSRIRSAWSPSTAASRTSATIRPRTGKSHVVHCLDAYQANRGLQPVSRTASISTTLAGYLRSTSMLPVISDFLFDDAPRSCCGAGAAERDARRVPRADRQRVRLRAAGALGRLDRDRGRRDRADAHDLALDAAAGSPTRCATGRPTSASAAKDADLDVVRIGLDQRQADIALERVRGRAPAAEDEELTVRSSATMLRVVILRSAVVHVAVGAAARRLEPAAGDAAATPVAVPDPSAPGGATAWSRSIRSAAGGARAPARCGSARRSR